MANCWSKSISQGDDAIRTGTPASRQRDSHSGTRTSMPAMAGSAATSPVHPAMMTGSPSSVTDMDDWSAAT